jgi:hypothetical protein
MQTKNNENWKIFKKIKTISFISRKVNYVDERLTSLLLILLIASIK